MLKYLILLFRETIKAIVYSFLQFKHKIQIVFFWIPHTAKTHKLQKVCWHLTTTSYILTSRWHLATTCYNKPIPGCVRMAYDNLLATSLLQVVNRFVASWLCKPVIHMFIANCFNKLQQVCNGQVATSLILIDLCMATWWNWIWWIYNYIRLATISKSTTIRPQTKRKYFANVNKTRKKLRYLKNW